MIISSLFDYVQSKFKHRKKAVEILDIVEEEEQFNFLLSVNRKLVPYEMKHNVTICFMNNSRLFQIEGVLHNIHDLEYEYLFVVNEGQIKIKNEIFYLNLMVGEKSYSINFSSKYSVKSGSKYFKEDIYLNLYMNNGAFYIDDIRSMLYLKPLNLVLINEKQKIKFTFQKPRLSGQIENYQLKLYDFQTKTEYDVPTQSNLTTRKLKVIGDLKNIPMEFTNLETILEVQINKEKSYYRIITKNV